jgi:chromosome segregation ATPase
VIGFAPELYVFLGGIVVAVTAGWFGYRGVLRQRSGSPQTSDAGELWNAATTIRKELWGELAEMRERLRGAEAELRLCAAARDDAAHRLEALEGQVEVETEKLQAARLRVTELGLEIKGLEAEAARVKKMWEDKDG